jgi:DNA helicase-2/ATP-dependent DNA helicase PcrA
MFVKADVAAELLESLNVEQRAAVTHEGGPLLVLAGAGTGKTTTLCSRVAWHVLAGVPPGRLLLLTFTRRAAREMVARARALMPRNESGSVVGGTFHSVAYQLICRHATAFGLPSRLSVLDAADAADLIDLLREEHGLADGRKRFPRKDTLLDLYSRCVNAQRQLSQVVAELFPWCEDHVEEIGRVFRAYGERKRQLALLDYDDLLIYWHALARDPVVGADLAGLFDQVLVDEYQDLNALQVEIVRELRREQRGLTVVGDDAQAIYGFRAASAEHILNFTNHFPDATVITLERNYRSTQPVLDLANVIAAGAMRAYPKRLRAVREGGSLPALVYCRDTLQEAVEVCTRVLDQYEQGTPLREQAVLMRAGHNSDALELELMRRRIPFVKYGGIRYLEAAHVKDFICLLRIANHPADQLSWFRILKLLDGVGPVTARRAIDALDLPHLDNLTELPGRWDTAAPLLHKRSQSAAYPLIAALATCGGDEAAGTVAERLQRVIAPLIRNHYHDGPARLSDLEQLVAVAAQAARLSSFLSELALDPPSSSADYAQPPHLDDDYLILSTVHSAKGLEWDAVHLIGATDGNFPSDMALSTPDGEEEERRLFYVALTRTRNTLAIHVPLRFYHRPTSRDDAHGYGKQSRFLTPDAEALCHRNDDFTSEEQSLRSDSRKDIRVSVDLASLWS